MAEMFVAVSLWRREEKEQEGETERCKMEQLPRARAFIFLGNNNRKLNGIVGDI